MPETPRDLFQTLLKQRLGLRVRILAPSGLDDGMVMSGFTQLDTQVHAS